MSGFQETAALLRHRLAELNHRVEQIEADLRAPQDQDSEERALDLEGDEVLEGVEQASINEMTQIEAALARIETGTYGVCVDCGADIAPARLAILPATPKCIACA